MAKIPFSISNTGYVLKPVNDYSEIKIESSKYLDPIDNYLYLQHLGDSGEFVVIPFYPDNINDNLSTQFNTQTPLARTAPVAAWVSGGGGRAISISLPLNRDLFENVNMEKSNLKIDDITKSDYIDTLIKKLQAMALPNYNAVTKMINPPQAALRIGNEIFVKGVVTSGVNVTYTKPILENGKYANVTIQFTITEVDPYDADTLVKDGSFRGITRTFKDILN